MHSSSFVTFCPTCFCFTDTSTTEIYTLSLHDALPIFVALQTDEVGVEDARHDLRDLRLADTGVALDQQRLAQARREMHGGGHRRVGNVLGRLHRLLDLANFLAHERLLYMKAREVLRRVHVGGHRDVELHDLDALR